MGNCAWRLPVCLWALPVPNYTAKLHQQQQRQQLWKQWRDNITVHWRYMTQHVNIQVIAPQPTHYKHIKNKTVLLETARERTTRGVTFPSVTSPRYGGTPSWPRLWSTMKWGTPPHQDWGTPTSGTGVPPGLGLGYPHLWLGYPYPELWYPLRKGPGTSHWSTPWKGHRTSESIMGWRWGIPPKKFRMRPQILEGDKA